MFVHAKKTVVSSGQFVPVDYSDCYIDLNCVVKIVPDQDNKSYCFLHLCADQDLSFPVYWSDQFDSIKNFYCIL